MANLPVFIANQADASPIRAWVPHHSGKPHYAPIDFTRVRPQVAHELRYAAATKLRRGSWGNAEYIALVMEGAVAACNALDLTSVLEPTKEQIAEAAAGRVRAPAVVNVTGAWAGIQRLVAQASAPSPRERERWQSRDVVPNHSGPSQNIHWDRVTCLWLRNAMMHLAHEQLTSGERAFTTWKRHVTAAAYFCRYLNQSGNQDLQPAALTRTVFLDFLAWARAQERPDLVSVNAVASLLEELRDRECLLELPQTRFLIRGEASINRTRKPKPFPADIVQAIDLMVKEDRQLSADLRLIFKVLRAIGPRPSELLILPLDCLQHAPGRGYSIEYFQSKIQDWRRVPISDELGRELSEHIQELRDEGRSQWLFPWRGRSPRQSALLTDQLPPWTYQSLTTKLWDAMKRNDITTSSLTGEVLLGSAPHRFRHTIATELLNLGWSQYEVQKFLGHKTPQMMQAYAEVTDVTLAEKYHAYLKHAVDIRGQRSETVPINELADVERLRDRMIRSTLPNGYCTLPEKQSCDFVPSPCLSCTAFFRTTPVFLPVHIKQRDEALQALEVAKADGRERAVAAHEQVVERLSVIIDGLEREAGEVAS